MALEPITREEKFLAKAGGQNVETPTPITRKEMFLQEVAKKSGGGGVSNWNDLADKPFFIVELEYDEKNYIPKLKNHSFEEVFQAATSNKFVFGVIDEGDGYYMKFPVVVGDGYYDEATDTLEPRVNFFNVQINGDYLSTSGLWVSENGGDYYPSDGFYSRPNISDYFIMRNEYGEYRVTITQSGSFDIKMI